MFETDDDFNENVCKTWSTKEITGLVYESSEKFCFSMPLELHSDVLHTIAKYYVSRGFCIFQYLKRKYFTGLF